MERLENKRIKKINTTKLSLKVQIIAILRKNKTDMLGIAKIIYVFLYAYTCVSGYISNLQLFYFASKSSIKLKK